MDARTCPVCLCAYNYNEQKPLILPACGHTLCAACCSGLLCPLCPECREPIGVPITQLPVNRSLLQLLEGTPLDHVLEDLNANDSRAAQALFIESHRLKLLGSAPLGTGGSGSVWRAALDGDKEVAVKLFDAMLPSTNDNQGLSSQCPMLRAFVTEVTTLMRASAACMYTSKFRGVSLKDNKPAIVMQLYKHGDLLRHIPEGGMPLARALRIGTMLAKALAEVHACNIIVGDLKPQNVLMTEYGDVVLTDFSISRIANNTLGGCLMSQALGTIQYMAPEQFDESGLVTPKADIWAWGCVMSQILSGKAPWGGLTMAQIMRQVAGQGKHPAIPEGIPPALHNIIEATLQSEPVERPTAQQLLAKLAALELEGGHGSRGGLTPASTCPLPAHSAVGGTGSVAAPHTTDLMPAGDQGARTGSSHSGTGHSRRRSMHGIMEGMEATPEVLQQLVRQLRGDDPALQEQSARQLAALAASNADRQTIAALPGCVQALVDQLASPDEGAASGAAVALKALAVDSGAEQAIARTPDCLERLCILLGSEETQRDAAAALRNLTCHDGSRQAVAAIPGALEQLVTLLGSRQSAIQELAAGVLRNLAGNNSANKVAIAAVPGSLSGLVQLLQSPVAAVQAQAAGCLRNLAADNIANKRDIASQPCALQRLVTLLSSPVPAVQEAAAGTLRNVAGMVGQTGPGVADINLNRRVIVDLGALDALAKLLRSPVVGVQEASAATIRNLAADGEATRADIVNTPGLARGLVDMLVSPSVAVQEQSAGALLCLLAYSSAHRRAIAAIPDCTKRLRELLQSPHASVQRIAEGIMRRLVHNTF